MKICTTKTCFIASSFQWIRIQTGWIRIQYRIRPILPYKLSNFVNLYFKVVKFVFGYNYSSLKILKLHNKVLLWSCDIVLTIFFSLFTYLVWFKGRIRIRIPVRIRYDLKYDPDPDQDQIIPNPQHCFFLFSQDLSQNMQLSVKENITKPPPFYVARNHMVRY
jgi:hypothetical protein